MTDTVPVQGLPLGISSFAKIRDNNQLYVDKTHFIKKLDDLQIFYPFIVRPRRFGKTLFTDILEAYYDKYQAENFEQRFAGTYIGQNKTKYQGQYYVLHLDFSAIGNTDLIKAFNKNLRSSFKNFFSRYPIPGYQDFLAEAYKATPAQFIEDFFDLIEDTVKNRLYIIIDEYDQFANNILANDPDTFREITRDDGLIKTFYAQIKKYTRSDLVSRLFVTGVTTISLDSMTSGFSIAENITNRPDFTDMFGFSESELRNLIRSSLKNTKFSMSEDEILIRMKDCYNGYRFSGKSDITVFNSEACVYYLRSVQQLGQEPQPLTVRSIGTDTDKMERILKLSDQNFVKHTVKSIIDGHSIKFNGFNDNLNLNEKSMLNDNDTLSVLFYMGYLTYSPSSATALVCPNKSMDSQFISYYLNKIEGYRSFKVGDENAQEIIHSMHKGDIRPLFDFVSSNLHPGTGVNAHKKFNESNIQTGIKAVVNITTDYRAYDEIEAQGIGFTDLLLVPLKKSAPTYLIELKHVKPAEKSDSVIQQKLKDAKTQLDRYAAAENLKPVQHLVKVAAVFSNFELLTMESY